MNWPKRVAILSILFFVPKLTACGVKGDPLPPEKPADLGRGRPTYKRAVKDIQRAEDEDKKQKTEKDKEKDRIKNEL